MISRRVRIETFVAEVEVEQSSSCHVRDVCAAEGSTLIIPNDVTLVRQLQWR